jgi:hypothetical protein
MYDSLHYPILFPSGECGWSHQKFSKDEIKSDTCAKFYQQLLQIRDDMNLLNFGHLSKEYIVDQYAKIEKTKLHTENQFLK